MICPVCQSTFSEGGVCPNCHLDVALFQKVRIAAAKLYNKGLSQAKEGDLSGAEASLLNSLKFDKHNCEARNLLGLVYYEKGRMGDALKHWIISNSLQKRNNPAQSYIEALQHNGRMLEQSNDAVRMYNQSRRYLNQGSEDLAIIQLKKAVGISPKLVEAECLLALCYLNAGERAKAEACLKRVLAMDVNNPFAKAYCEELGIAPIKAPVEKAPEKKTGGRQRKADTVRHEKRIADALKNSKRKLLVMAPTEIAALAVGIVVTAIVMLTLVLPALVDQKDQSISDLTGKLTEANSRVTTLEEELQTLRAENNALQTQVADYQTQTDIQGKQAKIQEAQGLIDAGDPGSAALLLLEMDTSNLPEDVAAAYNAAKDASFSAGAQSFYNAGRAAFMDSDYESALPQFENALKLASSEDFVDDAVYYIGRIAQETGDAAKAKRYFERVINEYPDSNQYQNAVNQLNNLQG